MAQLLEIIRSIHSLCQCGDDIIDTEKIIFFIFIPNHTYLVVFKQFYQQFL